MTKNGFKCPHCGVVHKEYVRLGKMISPRCMKCNKLVRIDLVPREYVQHRPKKSGPKRDKDIVVHEEERRKDMKGEKGEEGRKDTKAVNGEEERKEKEREEKKVSSLFIVPKTPHEILEEVLSEFGCNSVFIKMMLRRSKRTGGIHPGDLKNYIATLGSGIRSSQQAAFIAEEYEFALNEERDKARSREYHRPAYPLERREHEKYEPPFGGRGGPEDVEFDKEGYIVPVREPSRERDERVSRRDVRAIIENSLERMEQKREREEVLRNMGSRITRIERAMDSIPGRINEGLSKILEKRQAEKPKEIAKADLKNTLKKTAQDLEKTFIERDFKKSVDEGGERDKGFQKAVETLSKEGNELSKERTELLTKLAAQGAAEPSVYQTDSGRVIGEAVRGLKDVIKTRQPLKDVVDGIPKLLYPGMDELEKGRAQS